MRSRTEPRGFSIVIPTFRRRVSLERVLEALRVQTYPHERLEVVVVNDGGSDSTSTMVRERRMPFPVRLLEQANLGPAAARNLGVENATGPFVLFLDDDVVPVPRLVAEHAAAHGDHDDLVVMGTMLGDGRERRPWLRWESETLAQQYAAIEQGVWEASQWQFYTGNASLMKEHVVRAGGFDVSLRRAEDIELGVRLQRLGLRFVFRRAAEGLHLMRRSWHSWLGAARQYGSNDVAFGEIEDRVVEETVYRHPHTIRLIAWGMRHRSLRAVVPPLARAAAEATYAVGASRASMAVCSAVFNLEYWIGVEQALGRTEMRNVLRRVEERAQVQPLFAGRRAGSRLES